MCDYAKFTAHQLAHLSGADIASALCMLIPGLSAVEAPTLTERPPRVNDTKWYIRYGGVRYPVYIDDHREIYCRTLITLINRMIIELEEHHYGKSINDKSAHSDHIANAASYLQKINTFVGDNRLGG